MPAKSFNLAVLRLAEINRLCRYRYGFHSALPLRSLLCVRHREVLPFGRIDCVNSASPSSVRSDRLLSKPRAARRSHSEAHRRVIAKTFIWILHSELIAARAVQGL